MKKCILLGFVFLSAIGARAEEEINYPTSITYGNIVYALTHHEDDDVVNGYSIKITNANVNTDDVLNTGGISMNTTANATRTNSYSFNAMATGVDGGTNVLYSLELNNFVTSEILPTESTQTGSTISLEKNSYAALMALAQANSSNIYTFEEISAPDNYCWKAWVTNDITGDDELKTIAAQDSLTLKAAFPKYRDAYYFLSVNKAGKRNYYLIEKVTHTETTNYTTTNQYICHVCDIHPNFRVPSTVTNITLGNEIWRIPDSSIFSEAPNLALITVSGTGSDFQFKKGILYKMEASMEKEIVTATTTLTDQTLPESIDSIYTDAFKNAPEGVVITSMNYNLSLNGNELFKVVFLIPDEKAKIEAAANGGYLVKGNLTQYNIDNLEIKGTYMNFTEAILLTDIHINNADSRSNTLLFFNENTGKEITGDKNVIIGENCEYCAITDNGSESFYCPWEFTAQELDYTRVFDCKWKTIALPFSLDDNTLDDLLIVGKLIGFDESTNTFNFQYSNSITANYPFIIRAKYDPRSIELRSIPNVVFKPTDPQIKKIGNVSFVPVFSRDTLWSSQNADQNYYGIQNIWNDEKKDWTNVMQIFDGVRINPFRSYLIGPKITTEAAKYRLVDAMDQLMEEGEFPITTSGIEDVKESKTNDAIYNLNGQRVNNAHRGLNIVNGKVVLNK